MSCPHIFVTCILSTLVLVVIVYGNYRTDSNNRLDVPNYTLIWIFFCYVMINIDLIRGLCVPNKGRGGYDLVNLKAHLE